MCYYRGVEKEQRMSKNRRRPHRGRREKKKKAGMLSNIILIVALAVFLRFSLSTCEDCRRLCKRP